MYIVNKKKREFLARSSFSDDRRLGMSGLLAALSILLDVCYLHNPSSEPVGSWAGDEITHLPTPPTAGFVNVSPKAMSVMMDMDDTMRLLSQRAKQSESWTEFITTYTEALGIWKERHGMNRG